MSSDPASYDFSYSDLVLMIGRMLFLSGLLIYVLFFDKSIIFSPKQLLSTPTASIIPNAINIVATI
jgi:hypothetical protein